MCVCVCSCECFYAIIFHGRMWNERNERKLARYIHFRGCNSFSFCSTINTCRCGRKFRSEFVIQYAEVIRPCVLTTRKLWRITKTHRRQQERRQDRQHWRHFPAFGMLRHFFLGRKNAWNLCAVVIWQKFLDAKTAQQSKVIHLNFNVIFAHFTQDKWGPSHNPE